MKNILNILEVNACGNEQAEKKLAFHGPMDDRILTLLNNLQKKGSWDLISVRDIQWRSLEKLQTKLKSQSYQMYIHKSWDDVPEKGRYRYKCLSALFVRDEPDFDFTQIYTSDQFDTVLRYVAGTISFAGSKILYKTSHIPCVGNPDDSCLEYWLQRKREMLKDEVAFQNAHQEELALSAGDYNGGPGKGWHCQEQYNQFVFEDTVTENTYKNTRIDHVFISKGLRNSTIQVETKVIDDDYMILTDHKVLSITLKDGQERKA